MAFKDIKYFQLSLGLKQRMHVQRKCKICMLSTVLLDPGPQQNEFKLSWIVFNWFASIGRLDFQGIEKARIFLKSKDLPEVQVDPRYSRLICLDSCPFRSCPWQVKRQSRHFTDTLKIKVHQI